MYVQKHPSQLLDDKNFDIETDKIKFCDKKEEEEDCGGWILKDQQFKESPNIFLPICFIYSFPALDLVDLDFFFPSKLANF